MWIRLFMRISSLPYLRTLGLPARQWTGSGNLPAAIPRFAAGRIHPGEMKIRKESTGWIWNIPQRLSLMNMIFKGVRLPADMSVPLAAMSMIPQNVTALPLRIFPMTGSAPAVKKDKRQVQQSIGPDLAEMSLCLPPEKETDTGPF